MKKGLFIIFFMVLSLAASSLWAADYQIISSQDLKNKLDAKEKVLLVNALSDIEFAIENIPGSINIPVGEVQTTDKLPAEKDAYIVFY